MALTYKLIASSTVGAGGAASITFSSIPSTYTDLKIVLSSRSARTNDSGGSDGKMEFNGDTGANYSSRVLFNASGSPLSFTSTSITYLSSSNTQTANTFGNTELYIPNYTSSTAKSVSIDTVAENNSATNYQELVASLWTGTSAITSIKLTDNQGGFLQYTTAYLYGISKS